ncbi:unnamed protein product, partial [Rotaria magnacalcarata]
NPETSSNLFDTYNVSPDTIQKVPNAPPFLKSFLLPTTTTTTTATITNVNDNSPTASTIFTIQKRITSIDNEDNTERIIMNHLHSVKSLKKFFETKMVIQRPISS